MVVAIEHWEACLIPPVRETLEFSRIFAANAGGYVCSKVQTTPHFKTDIEIIVPVSYGRSIFKEEPELVCLSLLVVT